MPHGQPYATYTCHTYLILPYASPCHVDTNAIITLIAITLFMRQRHAALRVSATLMLMMALIAFAVIAAAPFATPYFDYAEAATYA